MSSVAQPALTHINGNDWRGAEDEVTSAVHSQSIRLIFHVCPCPVLIGQSALPLWHRDGTTVYSTRNGGVAGG